VKAAGWVAGLTLAVFALVLSLVIGPRTLLQIAGAAAPIFEQDDPPPTELPAGGGFRTAWAYPRSTANAPRPGDVVLERVVAASEPFAAHDPEPLYQAAFMARLCQLAVIITLDDEPNVGGVPAFVERASGTIDEVLVNHTSRRVQIGSRLWLASHDGTRVTRVGTTQVVERYSYVRVPRAGGQYLVFIGYRGGPEEGGGSAQIAYGNAFEIRRRSVVGMTVPGDSWTRRSSLERVRAVVRRRADLPAPQPGDSETREALLR
jgi:hypothetical protein